MERNRLSGNPLAAPHSQNFSNGRGPRGAEAQNNPTHRHSHVTPTHGGGPTFLRPLPRLLQRLLLPQAAGGWRRFGFRRYLWLLKRHHQRDAQRDGGRRLATPLAQLGVASPLQELPLENSSLRSTLQHRGPGWWFRATALRGEEAGQELLRQLLLQQRLWLQLRRSKQRRRRLQSRRGRSVPPARQRGWLENLKRLRRPLQRSRRRHQLKARENLGRTYREPELRLLTYRLVAALEPKRQRHRRRGRRAHQRGGAPARRMLQWLRGGHLPQWGASRSVLQNLKRRLRSRSRSLRQLRLRWRLQRRSQLEHQRWGLRFMRRWLKRREAQATQAKRRREEEEGEGKGELPGPPAANAEERRLEEADQQQELVGVGRLATRLARLEELLRHDPFAEDLSRPAPAPASAPDRNLWAVALATQRLLQSPGEPQRRQLGRALRRWRRRLEQRRQQRLLQHPLLLAEDQRKLEGRMATGWEEQLREEYRLEEERRLELRQLPSGSRGPLGGPTGLGHPGGKAPRRSLPELQERWNTYFQPAPGDGFRFFLPLSPVAKNGLFR
jgi:hypothetical protein